MKISSLIIFPFLGVVSAGINGKKPNGPTYAGTNPNCTWYLDLVDDSYTCENIESQWDLKHEVFVAWNPGLKKDCSGLKIGLSVCVEAPMESITATPTSEASTPVKTSTTLPTANGPPLPSPTQDGLVGNCTKFHRAVSGDTCGKIISRYKPVTLDQFIEWNPAVEKDCSGLWSGYHYCVGIPGTPSALPTSISASTSRSSTNSHTTVKPAAPGPTQDGIVNNCQRWHKALSGNTCASLLNQYGTFTLEEFIKWNPAVGKDCSGLWLNYYYCIGVPGTPTTKKPMPKPTPTGCNSPGLPSPTQPGAICQCSKWHQVRQGDTCDNITRNYRISISKFKEWNPNVGKDCYGLWLRYYVCVGGK